MKIFKKIFKGNTLYYPGCLTKFVCKDKLEKYKKILTVEGIDFIMLKEREMCCGSPVKNAGAKRAFEDLAKKNLAVFREHGVDRIISNCPSCVAVFKQDYPEVLGDQWEIEVQHISEVIERSLANLKKVDKEQKATFHDPCHLGRALGIFEQPRKVIKQAGYQLVEMEYAREKSACCGAGGGVKGNATELANRIGGDRIEQAQESRANVLITNCPMCYKQLEENSSELQVLELCDLFDL